MIEELLEELTPLPEQVRVALAAGHDPHLMVLEMAAMVQQVIDGHNEFRRETIKAVGQLAASVRDVDGRAAAQFAQHQGALNQLFGRLKAVEGVTRMFGNRQQRRAAGGGR